MAAFLLAACTSIAPPSGPALVGKPYVVNGVRYVPREDPNYDVVGRASWYGRPFHGRRTASGRIYDMNALTAAHPTLPFGTQVRVTNLASNRSVVLTVNDRGPFAKGRIIDVSRRAAQLLGFYRTGTARVRVKVVPSARASSAGLHTPEARRATGWRP
ncbi:MAG: septal ring lytic transglycosylase RlpA family protein [Kiloniellaceae bacterium]